LYGRQPATLGGSISRPLSKRTGNLRCRFELNVEYLNTKAAIEMVKMVTSGDFRLLDNYESTF
jgi:hypothetical protein